MSYPHERIKISGCTFEFKSNLNSNANQLIPIHLGMRREGARLHCAWKGFMRYSFSCEIWGVKVDKVMKAQEISYPFKFKHALNLNG